MRIAINGLGRMGRLALRAGWEMPELDFVALNEPAGDAANLALLLEFDSLYGRWEQPCREVDGGIAIGERKIPLSQADEPSALPWQELGLDLILECSGAFRTRAALDSHRKLAPQVLVSAPVRDIEANIVVGVNDGAFDLAETELFSAASCTTNCLAPVVSVLHAALGIERGLVTTIHAPTNTQEVVDRVQRDPRRARSASQHLIPTSTNSAYAVTLILPALAGKLDSVAVRNPCLGASISDCVFHVARETSAEEVNGALRRAADSGPLRGILGIEDRPLVSGDYRGDSRSAIVDAPSTRVCDGTLVKVLAWYDNEWGYVCRMVELARRIARARAAA